MCGWGTGGWEEYSLLRRKYELDEVGSVHQWKMKIKKRNFCDWEKEVESKSSLRWYMFEKDDGTERYTRSCKDVKV